MIRKMNTTYTLLGDKSMSPLSWYFNIGISINNLKEQMNIYG